MSVGTQTGCAIGQWDSHPLQVVSGGRGVLVGVCEGVRVCDGWEGGELGGEV